MDGYDTGGIGGKTGAGPSKRSASASDKLSGPPVTPIRKRKKSSPSSKAKDGDNSVAASSRPRVKPSPGKTSSTKKATVALAAAGFSAMVGPVPGGVPGSSIYCVCHSSDEGFMVECSDGTGGCGGWFHPECCNLQLSPEQMEKSAMKKFKFVCSLCVKVRLKAEKRKGKGKSKGKKGSGASPGGDSGETAVESRDNRGAAAAVAAAGVGSGFHGNVEIVSPSNAPKKPRSRDKQPKKSPAAASAAAATVSSNIPKKRSKTAAAAGDPVVLNVNASVDGGDSTDTTMPPPAASTSPSNRIIIKRRRSSGATSRRRGEEDGKPRSRRPKLKRPRSTEATKRLATDASDADDSWGEESVEGDGRGERGTRSSAYGTRDRSGRVKYVEEASDNEDDYLTDEGADGNPSGKRGGMASLGDTGRAGSSSSLSSTGVSRSDRDGTGGRGGTTAEWGGVAGRGPPVAPLCDYVVDKILGRKVFLVSPEEDEEDNDGGGENAGGAGKARVGSSGELVRKEMYLVKWKNLSYLHNSWEMAAHLEDPRYPSNRQKLLRFNSKMEQEHGPQWRKLMEAEDLEEGAAEKEYFPADMVEVQRIITCETTQTLHEAVLRRERHDLITGDLAAAADTGDCDDVDVEGDDVSKKPKQLKHQKASRRDSVTEKRGNGGSAAEESDDPDDNILYLVKWRGLPYDQSSWEHFKDIRFASDQILDFWDFSRPRPEEMAKVEEQLAKSGGSKAGGRGGRGGSGAGSKGHSLRMRDFTKLSASPVFGVTSAERAARGVEKDESDQEAFASGGGGLTLRDYQLEGVNWLLWNWWNHRSSILADEMGLGKTVQTVGFLDQLWNNKLTEIRGPFCVVAPLSLVAQWQSEVATWSPDMNVIVYHGNGSSRALLREREFWHAEPFVTKSQAAKLRSAGRVKFHILITTYEVALKDVRELSRIQWKVLIVDEAHRLKNCDSKLFQEMRSIPRDHSLLLTGTPLQNKTEELWALLNFADSNMFFDQKGFKEEFGDLKGSSQVAKLHAMLRPYLLRRVKEDVEKSLPPKEETIVEVSLTPVQRQFYRAIYERNTHFLFKGARPVHAPSLMNIMMELRKCCNHPFLNRGVEERIMSEIPDELHTRANMHKQLVDASGKMVLLAKLLPRLLAEGHKVLIFSQMVRCLDLIEDFLKGGIDGNGPGYKYERLDGNTRANMRTAAVERFNRPQFKRFVMLLSTRAGGLGLNLTSADTVIIYDSDWNPHNDLQAQARAHRIGQTKAVMVYRLLSKKTYEMHMFHQASLKLGLDKAVLAHARNEAQQDADNAVLEGEDKKDGTGQSASGMISARGMGKPDLASEEIDHLLKRGAYDVFREDDEEGKDFVEANIDDIMKRAATKITYGNKASMSQLSTSFSKASFVAKDQAEEVDLDDPDFWKKAIGLVEQSPQEDKSKPDEDLPGQRNRKQTKIFDPHSNQDDDEDSNANLAGRAAKYKRGFDSEFSDDSAGSDLGGTESRDGRGDEEYLLESGSTSGRRDRSSSKKSSSSKGSRIRPTKPMKDWGTHNRDRLVRSLQLYGFGRWTRIRKEAGASIRPLEDVESFARSYVLQAGVCAREEERLLEAKAEGAGEGEDGGGASGSHGNNASNGGTNSNGKRPPTKEEDSEFVRQAMSAAKDIQDQIANGERTIDIPAVLREDKFVEKLVKHSLAKKALQRLDLLRRLQMNISKSCETVMRQMPRAERQKYESIEDMEQQVAALTPFGLSNTLPMGDIRPKWAAVQPWWDLDCDRELLLATYLHGFGSYPKMRVDHHLCFSSKILGLVLWNPDAGGTDATSASDGASSGHGNGQDKDKDKEKDKDVDKDRGKEKEKTEETTTQTSSATASQSPKTPYVPEPPTVGKRISGFRGVFSQPGSVRWVALARDGEYGCLLLGSHDTQVGAAKAYDKFCRKLYVTLERQAGNKDPDPSSAETNFDLQGTRRPQVTNAEDDWKRSLPWHRSSCYHGVRACGQRWTALSTANKDSLLGFYPTEVQAAMACDDNTRRTAAPPPAETSGTTSGNSMDVDDAAVNDASSTPSTAAAAAGSSGASSTSGTSTSLPLTLNFTSDEEAQERLDAVAMFEAGLNPEDGSEADPSLVVVASKGGQLRTLRDLQKERDALRLGGAADHSPEDGGVNGNGASPMEVEDGGKAFSTRDDAENGGGHGQKERQQNGADGAARGANGVPDEVPVPKEWRLLPLRGCGTDVGGEWEAAGRRAASIPMPDVRLLNRLVQYLGTSKHALELKSERQKKSAAKAAAGSSSASGASGPSGGSGGGSAGSGSGSKGSVPTSRKRASGSSSSAKRPKQSVDELDIKEVAEDRRLGVMTDRQENGAIALIQAWAEGSWGQDSTPPDLQTWRATLQANLKELPKQTVACKPSTWTFWERKMLCAALLAQGAPSSNNDDTIHPGIIRLMQGREPFDTSMDGMDMEVMKGFTWESIISRANLTRTPDDVAHYYVKHFLPLCVELCRPDAIPADKPAASNASKADADPSISSSADNSTSTPAFQDQGSGSSGKSQAGGGERAGTVTSGSTAPEASDQLSFFPDPTREVADHSPVARGVAYIFLKRQQLLRTLRFYLYKRKDEVAKWSRNQQSAQVKHDRDGLPLWWCPWIHDLGLMAGCVRHGFMNVNAMRSDTTLPLNPSSILDHITRALVVGVEDPMSQMDKDFPTAGVAPTAGLPQDGGKTAASPRSQSSVASSSAAAAAAVRAGKGLDGTDEKVQAWAEEASEEFPTRRATEERVFRICVSLTKLLPHSNPLRVRSYNERSS
ncbi:unnamed protein product [Ascophyllum nodosum]